MNEKDKWAVAECLGRKIGLDDYAYELASDAVDLLIARGWFPPAPPTDAEIEAAARAIYRCAWSKDGFLDPECVWDKEGPEYQQFCRDEARAALVAARKVARHE